MRLTTAILGTLLKHPAKGQAVCADAASVVVLRDSNLEITEIQLTSGSASPEEHVLYVCSDQSQIVQTARKSAFVLVCSTSSPVPPCEAGQPSVDTIAIATDKTPLEMLYSLYSLMLHLQDWDKRLEQNTLTPYHFYQLFNVGPGLYPFPFCMVNHEFAVVAKTPDMNELSPSGERPRNNVISERRAEELLSDPTFQATEQAMGVYTYPTWQEGVTRLCFNIRQDGNYLGRVLSDVTEDTPGVRALFRHLAEHLSRAFLAYADDVMLSRSNDALHTLLAKALKADVRPDEEARITLQRANWKEKDACRVSIISLSGQQSIRMLCPYLSHLLEQAFVPSCAIAEGESIVFVAQSSEPAKKFQKRLLDVTSMWSLSLGMSSPAAFDQLNIAYKQALFALSCVNDIDGERCRQFSACHLDYLVYVLQRDMPNEDFIHPGLRRLREKDEREHTNDTQLVWELIASGFNVTHAAQKCFVHRSTFIRRLHEISGITGIDFSEPLDPETLLELLVSFRLIARQKK